MNHRTVGLSLVVLSTMLAVARAEGPSFGDVVHQRFGHWDQNRNGLLDADEVNPALVHPSIRGPEAAALTAVHLYQRRVKDADDKRLWPPLSREFILSSTTEPEERRDAEVAVPNFHLWYDGFVAHLGERPRTLFASGAPSLVGFKQGRLGDCFFLAVVGSAAHRTPDRLRQMITPHPNGAYDVVFGDGREVRLPHLTDSQILLGSTVGEQGLWLNVLEQAFSEVWVAQRTRSRPDELSIDVLSRGGLSRQVIPILTGHAARLVPFRSKASVPPNYEEAARLEAEVAEILTAAHRKRRLTTCGTLTAKPLPAGIPGNHVLAVLDFDPRARVVEVWNPWCNNRAPKGEPGLEHGYETRGGRFVMPLAEFVRTFYSMTYETDEPAGS